MECFELIQRLIHRDAVVDLGEVYGRPMVSLREPECESEAAIYNIPSDTIVVRLDGRFDVGRIFSGSYGECKRSDFILIAEHNAKIVFVHIEMKLTRGSNPEICHQLRGSHCFVFYMQEVGRMFAGHNTFLSQTVHRFVSIRNTGPRKRKTKIDRVVGQNDAPERAMKISSPRRIEFNQICNGI